MCWDLKPVYLTRRTFPISNSPTRSFYGYADASTGRLRSIRVERTRTHSQNMAYGMSHTYVVHTARDARHPAPAAIAHQPS